MSCSLSTIKKRIIALAHYSLKKFKVAISRKILLNIFPSLKMISSIMLWLKAYELIEKSQLFISLLLFWTTIHEV